MTSSSLREDDIVGETDVFGWTDALLSGVDEIDRQHRILVDMLVELAGKPVDGDALFDRITQDLLAYAIYHFETEERLMQTTGYVNARKDEQEAHVRAHRGFTQQVVAMREEAREELPGANEALLAFLKDWLVNHILTADKRLGQYVCDVRH